MHRLLMASLKQSWVKKKKKKEKGKHVTAGQGGENIWGVMLPISVAQALD